LRLVSELKPGYKLVDFGKHPGWIKNFELSSGCCSEIMKLIHVPVFAGLLKSGKDMNYFIDSFCRCSKQSLG